MTRSSAVAMKSVAAAQSGLLIAGLIGGSTLLAFAGAGGLLRPVFPVTSGLLAGYFLITGRRESLVQLILWLFMLTPCLRRIVDLSAGWEEVNILLLAPYAASVMCVPLALQGLFGRGFRYGFPFAILLGCVIYGLLLAAVDGRVVAAFYDTLRWGVPPCLGIMVATDPDRRVSYRDTITKTLAFGITGMGLYAVYQYLFVPPWDAYWMNNADINSIGIPVPFMIRVFSTMNSPGSFAGFSMCGLLMVLPSKRLSRWPAFVLGSAAILLSIVRSDWIGLVLGFGYMLVASRGWQVRGVILAAGLMLVMSLSVVSLIPEASVMIGDRLDSLTSLSGDTSAVDRSNGYTNFFKFSLGKYPFGRGLAISGTYVSSLNEGDTVIIDGAVIEIGTALGVIGGIAYLASVLLLALLAVMAGMGAADGFTTGCGAAVFASTLLLSSATVTVGEGGSIYWLAVGLCLSAAQAKAPYRVFRKGSFA